MNSYVDRAKGGVYLEVVRVELLMDRSNKDQVHTVMFVTYRIKGNNSNEVYEESSIRMYAHTEPVLEDGCADLENLLTKYLEVKLGINPKPSNGEVNETPDNIIRLDPNTKIN